MDVQCHAAYFNYAASPAICNEKFIHSRPCEISSGHRRDMRTATRETMMEIKLGIAEIHGNSFLHAEEISSCSQLLSRRMEMQIARKCRIFTGNTTDLSADTKRSDVKGAGRSVLRLG